MSDLYWDVIKREAFIQENETTYINSRYKFLNAHHGFRPGCLHLFIGVAGTGKSTITRSMLTDSINSARGPIILWLTEEEREDFNINYKDLPDIEQLRKIFVYSEIDPEQEYIQSINIWLYLNDLINSKKPCAIFIDNITTSCYYAEKTSKEQLDFVKSLKQLAKKYNIPVVIMAHTAALINDNMSRLIESNDIRGTKSIINLVEYLYVMQRFQIDESFYQTIRIRKSRKHQIKESFYRLVYSSLKNTYTHDLPVPFKEFKEAFAKRNTLDTRRF